MPHPPGVADLLAALAGVLARLGVRWYLFGAQAVMVWGRPRLSADVDVTVALGAGRVAELVDALGAAGFRPRIVRDLDAFVARTRVVPLVHESSQLPLDLVLAGSGLEQEFLGRAKPVDLDGVTVPVIAPDDLLVTKFLAGRPKDLEDARAVLERAHRGLDLDRVRTLLRSLDRVLDRGDLERQLDAELARLRPG